MIHLGFRIKPDAEMTVENTYLKLNTEGYGGSILSTWFDRPLSIAGRVVLKAEDILCPREEIIKHKQTNLYNTKLSYSHE